MGTLAYGKTRYTHYNILCREKSTIDLQLILSDLKKQLSNQSGFFFLTLSYTVL